VTSWRVARWLCRLLGSQLGSQLTRTERTCQHGCGHSSISRSGRRAAALLKDGVGAVRVLDLVTCLFAVTCPCQRAYPCQAHIRGLH